MRLGQWMAAFALMLSSAAVAEEPESAPLAERVERLPDDRFREWFGVMLSMEYDTTPYQQIFFGDVGPTEGCAPMRLMRNEIVKRDLPAFRSAFVDAVARGFNPAVFADVPDKFLNMPFNSRIGRMHRALRPFLAARATELAHRAQKWADDRGYRGKRRGYNQAGVAYWRQQPALIGLICGAPDNAEGFLRGWKE